QAVLHIEYNPFECRPRGPTISHGCSIPGLKSVDVERQEPTIAYAQYSVPNYSSLWTDRSKNLRLQQRGLHPLPLSRYFPLQKGCENAHSAEQASTQVGNGNTGAHRTLPREARNQHQP